MEKHQRDGDDDDDDDELKWRRLTQITNNKLKKFRLNFSR